MIDMIEWNTILSQLASNGIIVAGIVYLWKTIVDTASANSNVQFKTVLEKDIERFRQELEKEEVEHKIRFENLHQKRAEAIYELYLSIVSTLEIVNKYVLIGGAPASEYREPTRLAVVELNRCFNRNRLFLNNDIASRMHWLVLMAFSAITLNSSQPDWNYIRKIFARDGEVAGLQKELEDEFRLILWIA